MVIAYMYTYRGKKTSRQQNCHCKHNYAYSLYSSIMLTHHSFEIKVTVATPSRQEPYSAELRGTEGKLARALLGRNSCSIAKAALSMEGVKEAIITQLLGTLNQECNGLCHRKKERSSLFRRIPVDTMVDFKWAQMIEELESRAPLLLRIFDCLVTRNDHRNKCKIGVAHYPGICTAIAIILKERCRDMCGLQSLVSLLLYSCHCEKQVCSLNVT